MNKQTRAPWPKQKLDAICESISDGDHQAPPQVDSGVPFITISNFDQQNGIDFSNTKFVPEEYYKALDPKRKARPGDVLYSVVGSFGIPVLVKNDRPFAFQRHIAILRPNHSLLPEFLFYSMKTPAFFHQADGAAVGAAQRTIGLSSLRGFTISLPPLSEQRRIVGILSAYDDLIDNNRKRIAILEEIARLDYRKRFGEKNQIRSTTLEEILDAIESGSRPKGGAATEGVPSIGAEKIESIGVYDFTSEKYVSREYYEKMRRGKVRSGDVLLYKDGAYAGKASMALNGFPHVEAAVNEHVFILRTHNLNAQCFLYCFLKQAETYEQLNTIASAKSCQPGLNQSDVLNLEIKLPPEDAIAEFERKAIVLFEAIVNLSKQNAVLAAARDALLPRLMKGGVA